MINDIFIEAHTCWLLLLVAKKKKKKMVHTRHAKQIENHCDELNTGSYAYTLLFHISLIFVEQKEKEEEKEEMPRNKNIINVCILLYTLYQIEIK